MKNLGWQLPIILLFFVSIVSLAAFSTITIGTDHVSSTPLIAERTPQAYEVGADTDDVRVFAYSVAGGDAHVRIDGDTIYAEARLVGKIEPTFTSTPPSISQPTAAPLIQPTAPQPTAAPSDGVSFNVINVANVRALPWGEVLGTVNPGESFAMTGIASPWLRFVWNGQESWVHGDLVQIAGDTRSLPIVTVNTTQPVAQQPPTPTPEPVTVVEQAPAFPFVQSSMQLESEVNYPAFYAKVAQNGNPAPDRWCVVYHDGKEVGRAKSINVFSMSNQGTPWTGDDHPYNCEIKFHQFNPQPWTGLWVMEIQDGVGITVGRSDIFTINQYYQQAWIEFTGH